MSTCSPTSNAAAAASEGTESRTFVPSVELSIICVNWNSLDYLRQCIRSIYANPPSVPFEIVVVDNASPEGGISTLKQQFPELRIVESEKNIGFAGANNLGFERSAGNKVLLLNPDTEIIGSAIDAMLEVFQSQPDAGIVGCKLLNTDLSVSTTSIQKFPTILNQLLTVEKVRLICPNSSLWDIGPLFTESSTPVKVDVIPGACMMLRRDVFQQVGGMSEEYFMYAEDIDLNYKASQIGYSSYYVGSARIIHHGGRSSSRQKVSQWSTIMTYRAMAKFYRKTRGRGYAAAYQLAMAGAAGTRLLLLAAMYPFGNRDEIQWSMSKWTTILKWAVGAEQLKVAY